MEENIETKLCTKCKTVKPVTEFSKINKTKDELKLYCKICERERLKIYYQNNKAKLAEKHHEYYRNNKDKIQVKKDIWYQENKEKMKDYNRVYYNEWFKKYPEKSKEYAKNARMKKKEIILKRNVEEGGE